MKVSEDQAAVLELWLPLDDKVKAVGAGYKQFIAQITEAKLMNDNNKPNISGLVLKSHRAKAM